MFKTRLLSGIVLVIVLIVTVGYGGNLLFAFLGIISLIGLTELYKVVEVQTKALGAAGYLAAVVYYGMLLTGNMEYVMMLSILFLILVMAVYVFTFPAYRAEQVMTVFFGFFYVAVMLSFVYQTRMLADGGVVVWLIFLSVGRLGGDEQICGNADWQAQDGAETESQEIGGGRNRRGGGRCSFGRIVRACYEPMGRHAG